VYFFYIDESGTRDPRTEKVREDGTRKSLEPLYVLTAVSLFEFKWRRFDSAITGVKLNLRDKLYRSKKMKLDLADCEVKSTWLRIPKLRNEKSQFLAALTDEERTQLAETFYNQIKPYHMHIFAVVMDKRKLHDYMDHDKLHKKAYEILLERIENYLREFHPKHHGVIVMDDTDKTINRSLSMKHAYFQREGNPQMRFSHIVEYPFFTDSKVSNGVQLADLCGYNIYRAFRDRDFRYSYFTRLLPHFYCSQRTLPGKLDGLKVWPDDSELVQFAQEEFIAYKTEQPSLFTGL
jgi:hypothetical protein